jgi:hypothetical protein
MTSRTSRALGAAAGLVLVSLLALGCSASDETASESGAEPTAASTTTTAAAAPVTTGNRQACAAATLQAAAAATFADPVLSDVVCEDDFATATLANGPGGELVVLFSLQDGTWVLVGNAPIAQAASAAPADFSPTAIPSWERARAARLARAASAGSGNANPPSSNPMTTRVNPETGMIEICEKQGADFVLCSPPSTPADPNAPVTPPVTSNFCRYNYNDPRCVESGQSFEPSR